MSSVLDKIKDIRREASINDNLGISFSPFVGVHYMRVGDDILVAKENNSTIERVSIENVTSIFVGDGSNVNRVFKNRGIISTVSKLRWFISSASVVIEASSKTIRFPCSPADVQKIVDRINSDISRFKSED